MNGTDRNGQERKVLEWNGRERNGLDGRGKEWKGSDGTGEDITRLSAFNNFLGG